MQILGCGHGHYDKGHCGQPECGNDFRKCPECNPQHEPASRSTDRSAVKTADDLFETAFGWRPGGTS